MSELTAKKEGESMAWEQKKTGELAVRDLKRDPQLAYELLGRLTEEELRNRKSDLEWALTCLPARRASPIDEQKVTCVKHTMAIISRCIKAGWNINALNISGRLWVSVGDLWIMPNFKIAEFSILHVACVLGNVDLVKALVEEQGADVNLLAGSPSQIQCSPLHLAIMKNDPALVEYLVDQGSDVELEGCIFEPPLGPEPAFSLVARERAGDSLRFPAKFTPLELLLSFDDCKDWCSSILEKLLSKGVNWHGADELLCAVHGGNLEFVKKVFDCVHENLRQEDFQWIGFWDDLGRLIREPLFVHLVKAFPRHLRCHQRPHLPERHTGPWLAELLQAFLSRGYDVNAIGDRGDPQLFAVLDFATRHDVDSVLLKAFLKYGNPVVNVKNRRGESPVGFILNEVGRRTARPRIHSADRPQPPNCANIVKLLVQHGADVSSLEVGAETNYVFDEDLLKLLCAAGARVKPDFLQYRRDPLSRQPTSITEEVNRMRPWLLNEGKEMRLNLQILCRATIRKSIRRGVGDLDQVDPQRLPPKLKNYVAMKEDLKKLM